MMAGNPTMLFSYLHGVFVGVHTANSPSAEEWREHCTVIERVRHETRGVLVYTQGGGPNTQQRQQMRAALHELPAPPTAILTASPWVRGIITSLNWFLGNRVAAFEPHDVDGALAHITRGDAPLKRDELVGVLSSLAQRLAVTLPGPISPTDGPAAAGHPKRGGIGSPGR